MPAVIFEISDWASCCMFTLWDLGVESIHIIEVENKLCTVATETNQNAIYTLVQELSSSSSVGIRRKFNRKHSGAAFGWNEDGCIIGSKCLVA